MSLTKIYWMDNLKKFLINIDSSIKKAIIKIDSNRKGFVCVITSTNQLVGIVTDGDIRRRLLEDEDLNQSIKNCTNTNCIYVNSEISHENIYKKLDDNIKVIPVVNEKKEILRLITKETIPQRIEKESYARAKSPVRISFGGGGSDTSFFFKDNNGAVINSTISIYSHATLFKRKDHKIKIDSYDLEKSVLYKDFDDFNSSDDDFRLIRALIKIIKPNYGFHLIIQSDFPVSSGLGGSSVVLSSILGCFNQFRDSKWTLYDMSEIAYEAERLNLGISGGWQDQYATVFGGFNFIEFKLEENLVFPLRLDENILLELEESLILCYTNTNHDSNKIHQNQKINTSDDKVKNNILANVALTYQMRNNLLKGDLNSFSKLLDKAWHFKKSFSSKISNSFLDKIYDGAIKNGASGGKLLGAGGGGYFLFFTPPKNRNKLISWINHKGLAYTSFRFESKGLQSWTYRK